MLPARRFQNLYNKVMTDSFIIAGRQFRSRLIVGTGKYKSFQETARALEASGADMVTVAVRRVNLDRTAESLLDFIDPKRYFLLPNTAGCYTAEEAIRAANAEHDDGRDADRGEEAERARREAEQHVEAGSARGRPAGRHADMLAQKIARQGLQERPDGGGGEQRAECGSCNDAQRDGRTVSRLDDA